jgi:uncharacterized protein involved in exopolysaccharide biosynthesis
MSARSTETLEILDELEQRPGMAFGIGELRALWAGRRVVARAVVAGIVLATAVAFLIPARYTAVTQLMPPDSQSAYNALMLAGMADKAGSLGAMAGDLLSLKTSGALFVGMLASPAIQNRLIDQFKLKEVYRVKLGEDAREMLTRNTSIVEDRKSGIITIALTDRNAARAASIDNAYVSALNEMSAELSTSSARREREFLETRLDAVKQQLSQAEHSFADFSSENNTLDIAQQGKAMLEATASLAGEWMAAQSELEGLRQIYTDNNPRVRELSARVAELRKNLDKLSGDGSEATAPPVKGSAVHTAADLPYPSIRKLPQLGAAYADRYREMKTQETVYELLTEQCELAKVQEAKETPTVRVLQPASIPERKSYPPRLFIILAVTLTATGLSAVWILSAERWNRRRTDDELKVFVQEAASKTRQYLTRWMPNGPGSNGSAQGAWKSSQRSSGPPMN